MATANKNKNKRKSTKKKDPVNAFTGEVILLIVLALSIILLVSNFGVGGFIGNTVSSFFFGLFGIPSYIFPFLLFIGVAFFMSNMRNPLAYKKLLAGAFLYAFICSLVQLLTDGYLDTNSLFDFFQSSARYHLGGGIVGGAICKVCSFAFGVAGAYILTILGLIISMIFLTQRSFIGFFRKLFRNINHMIAGYRARREETRPEREAKAEAKAEARAQRAAERAQIRSERKDEREVQREKELEEDSRKSDRAVRRRAKRGESEEDDSLFLDGTKLSAPDEDPEAAEEPPSFEIHRSAPAEEELSDLPDFSDLPGTTPLNGKSAPGSEAPEPVPEASAGTAQRSPRKNPRSSGQEISSGIVNIRKEIGEQEEKQPEKYQFPPLSLLKKGEGGKVGDSDAHLRDTAIKLQTTLHNFGVNVTVTNISCGPTVTRYELQPEQGVRVNKIVSLTDDIKLNLAAPDIRIEAPIPGKSAVGIEVPNKENSAVMLRDLLQSHEFRSAKSLLSFAAGKDIAGKPVVTDIARMPHLLIAGATGSGKSVCINTLIMSILYKAPPEEVKLIMIDPKVVELSVYNGIPHLMIPVVTDPKKAAGALNWAVAEMTDRYNTFAEYNVRNLDDYNAKAAQITPAEGEEAPKRLPKIVIIVDELADLMMVAPGEVEDAICRLAQLARAAGIHLVIATQRPSVNVITGLIKANMPSRIAFSVSSGVDSRTILDMNGAEKLLGKGDMLFYPQGYQKPARLQGAFVSDEEVSAVVEFLSAKNPASSYSEEIEQKISTIGSAQGPNAGDDDGRDVYFVDAGKFIIEKDKASIGMLQRMFKIGFNRAARIMDQLSAAGVVGPEEGTKPRKILMSMEEFDSYVQEYL